MTPTEQLALLETILEPLLKRREKLEERIRQERDVEESRLVEMVTRNHRTVHADVVGGCDWCSFIVEHGGPE